MALIMRLNDGWRLHPDLDGAARINPTDPTRPTGEGRPVVVPGYWQLQFKDLERATGAVWYHLRFDLIEPVVSCESLALHFGAVSHFSQVWLNGYYLGEHDGGHLPFHWSVTEEARFGINDLWLRCVTPSSNRLLYPDFPVDETLHGKQSWYGPTGGIWQSVKLVGRARQHIDQVSVRADSSSASFTVTVTVAVKGGHLPEGGSIVLTVLDPDGDELVVERIANPSPVVTTTIDLGQQPRRWSLEDPALHRLVATIDVNGEITDQVAKPFGFRSFTTVDGRFVLNGQPVSMFGVLDQDFHDGFGVAAEAAIRHRLTLVKSMGFNTVRCHIKVPDPTYLDIADELGILVWCELPSTSRMTERSKRRMIDTLEGMVRRDSHHPSLVIRSVINESWGLDLVDNPDHRRWLMETADRLRAADGDRLVVDNSPCEPNFHVQTDIDDYHFYALIPEMRSRWDQFVDAFAARSAPTFSPYGDAVSSGQEPLVVSEFGMWGLPMLDWIDPQAEPWWFESGHEWAGGAAYVHGYDRRFALWHFDRVFGDWAGLSAATQDRQFETLRYQIDSIRLRPEIAGFVVTELTDVHWEANGLLDMRDNPRRFATRMPDLNARTRLIVGHGVTPTSAGGSIEIPVSIVGPVEGSPGPAKVEWSCSLGGSQGTIIGPSSPDGLVRHLEPIGVDLPAVDRPHTAELKASLLMDGGTVADDCVSILVLPTGVPKTSDPVIETSDPVLVNRLSELGYDVQPPSNSDRLRVVCEMTADDHRYVRSGGRILLLVRDTGSFGSGFAEFPRIRLEQWDEALHDGGHWVSAFSWLRRTGQFARLPGGPLFDLALDGLTVDVVVAGVPPARFEHAVYAGVFVGWIHQVNALIVRHDVGLGSVLINTVQLIDPSDRSRPMADWLMHQLIATAREP